ncbi:MAG: caspase family protein, partial [Elusimicrobiota bacterium]|nr:caspase family protein [Elusimicrobiota bacterium]
DKIISSVKFGDKELKKASFEVEKGNYEDVHPFEEKITLTPDIELVLKAIDESGKTTEIPINIEEPVIDYTPKYVQLEVKDKAPIREKPDTYSNVLTNVDQKTILVAVGTKSSWYYLEGGGWIHSSVVKEKEIGIKEVALSPVDLKAEKPSAQQPRILAKPVDVDVDIPEGKPNPDAIGVIICIKDYENKDVPSVEFAINDGETMKNYFNKLFGIKEDNIIFLKNAKKSDFERLFGTKDDHKGQVYNWVKPDVSDVYVYYGGHGAPDVKTKEAYSLPSDAHPNYVRLNGYPMDLLYSNLSKIPAKSITLITDACFSGQSEKGMLIARASGIAIIPKVKFSGTLFTASSGEEVASWYPEKNHSLFTYFLLKGLKGSADKNSDKKITLGEISEYIKENVT